MNIRSLPRLFLPGASASDAIDLPKHEVDKLRKVLRLDQGAEIAVLPNDGTLIRCTFRGHQAIPLEVVQPKTEPQLRLTLAQALPKGDKLELVVRMGTELGVSRFIFFPSDRSIVKWEPAKLQERIRRYRAIAQEAAEQSFRTGLPEIEVAASLAEVLQREPAAIVLSEGEGVASRLTRTREPVCLVVGPEGGWSPREISQIGARAITLGPRVLRAETAGPAAAAVLLLEHDLKV